MDGSTTRRLTRRFLLGIALLAPAVLFAGPEPLPDGKEQIPVIQQSEAPPTITNNDHWYFNIGMPGWMAGLSGDIGLDGITSDVDVGFGQIISHTAGIASLRAEARYDRFGVYGDLLYLSLSDGVYPTGLVKKANLTLDQYLADGDVYYRVLEGPRGWLDLRAGARYTNVFSRLELTAANAKVDQAATDLVNAANADLREILDRLLNGALDPNNPPLPIPPLGAEQKIKLLKLIQQARQDPMTAYKKITKLLKTRLNRGYGLTEYWLDPYIGVGGRYNLSKRFKAFYLTGKADVGGFGAGSDVTVQTYGAVGCHITRNIYSELGYRYLYYDYNSDGFLYRVSMHGPQITAGIEF
jgi:hypothetical protein